MALSGVALVRAGASAGLLAPEAEQALLEDARRARRDPLDLATARLRLAPEVFYRALAAQRGLPFLTGAGLVPDPELVARLPTPLLERKLVLPVGLVGHAVQLATADPDDEGALESVRRLLGRPLALALAEPEALRAAIRRAVSGIGSGALGQGAAARRAPAPAAGAFDGVAFLDDLLRQAWLRRASDVHLEPRRDGLAVRLRVDGQLHVHGYPLLGEEALHVLSRVKVLAGLDIAERREPQDGGFRHEVPEAGPDGSGRALDVRVATLPTRHGERVTLRLLGAETQDLTLERLGFAPAELARVQEVLTRTHGLVLLTGPTGSGKSTTLYAALRAVQAERLNIMTVEDPIEFELEGVNQVQVDRMGKVTFARALRAILRHDPDVIMVGEVRDAETADVALKAALTGHLVLSSLHTNRATTAPTRLTDIGCEPYLIASTLQAAISQRLVRRLCSSCRAARVAQPHELDRVGGAGEAQVWEPVGCPRCMGTGYAGRLAVSEALWVTDALARAIASGVREEELREQARQTGFCSLAEDALAKVLAGETSLEEAVRCTSLT